MSEQISSVQYTLEDISPVEKCLQAQVDTHYLSRKTEEVFREFSKEAELPGFRRGKAPRNLIEQRFQKAIWATVLDRLFDEAMEHLSTYEDLRLVTRPDWEAIPSRDTGGTPLVYRLRFETYPKVDLVSYEGFSVSQPLRPVTEEEIDRTLQHRREDMERMVPIQGRDTLAETDFVKVKLTAEVGAKQFHDTEEQFGLWADGGEPIVGLAAAMRGLGVSAAHQELTWEGDQGPVSARVTVIEAHERKLPALDDEFAKDTGEAQTLQELRNVVRQQLEEGRKRSAQARLRAQLIELLVASNPVPLPTAMVMHKTYDLLQNNRTRLVRELIVRKRITMADVTVDLLREHADAVARRDVTFSLLLPQLVEKAQVQVGEEEVTRYLTDLGRQFGIDAQIVRGILSKEDPGLRNVQSTLLEEKVLDWVEKRSTVQWTEEGTSHDQDE